MVLNIKELKEPDELTWFEKVTSFNIIPEKWKPRLSSWSQSLWHGMCLAQQGFGFLSKATWIIATGAIVLYLPVLRALDSDSETIRMLHVEMAQRNATAGRGGETIDLSQLGIKL
jgi:hypothetical protein